MSSSTLCIALIKNGQIGRFLYALHWHYMLHQYVYKLNHLSELYAKVLKPYCFIASAHATHVQPAG